MVAAQVYPVVVSGDLLLINSDINFRSQEKVSNVLGWLKAGSIVEVPARFVRRNTNGTPDVELTLKEWVMQPRVYSGTKKGYFYPVTLYWAKPGSDPQLASGQEGVMALKYLSRIKPAGKGSSLKFITTEEAALIRSQAAAPATGPTSAVAVAPVSAPVAAPAQPVTVAAPKEAPASAARAEGAAPGRIELSSNCGISYHDLRPELRRISQSIDVPLSEVQALFSVESAGNCRAVNQTRAQARKGKASLGLFQIETELSATDGVRSCSSEGEDSETARIAGIHTLQEMAQGPQCVQNPVFAARVMADRYSDNERMLKSAVVRDCSKPFRGLPRMDEFPEFKRQVLRSAYNGGACWVAEAASLAEESNRAEGKPIYDIYNWNDLKAAMLLPESKRKQSWAEVNIEYVDRVGDIARTYEPRNLTPRPVAPAPTVLQAADPAPEGPGRAG
jgi:hypothetical protein